MPGSGRLGPRDGTHPVVEPVPRGVDQHRPVVGMPVPGPVKQRRHIILKLRCLAPSRAQKSQQTEQQGYAHEKG